MTTRLQKFGAGMIGLSFLLVGGPATISPGRADRAGTGELRFDGVLVIDVPPLTPSI